MQPVPAPAEAHRLARRVLVAALAVQLLFFVFAVKESVLAALREPARAQTIGAAVAGIDSHGYYAWLRSPLVDGDFHFDNEFAFYNRHWPGTGYAGRTPTGKHVNHWSVGPALAWSVGVVPVHLALGATGARGEGSDAAHTPAYQLAVGSVTFALAVVTLLLMYATARRFAPPVASAVAAAGVALGAPLLAYGTVLPGMSHGPAGAALAAFVFAWVRTLGSASAWRWFGLGALLGIACLMRWQLATFGVLLALEAAWSARGGAARLALAAAGALVGFLPQVLAWHAVYGTPLVGQHSFSPDRLLSPSLWRVLGSSDRGLFYWTPVALVATLGAVYAVARSERKTAVPLAALLLAAAAQVYAIAVLLDGNIFLGASFGFRFLTETCVVLAPGLAACLAYVRPAVARLLGAGVCLLVCWNLLLVIGTRADRVPCGGPACPAELLRAVVATVERKPLDCVAAIVFAGWFSAAVVSGLRPRAAFRQDEAQLPSWARRAA